MNDESHTSDFDLVRRNPAAWYRDPQAILDDPQLRRDEKRALLAEWEQDLVDRSAAADEGMVPDATGTIERDVSMQDRVTEALAKLEGDETDAPDANFVERLWRRIAG